MDIEHYSHAQGAQKLLTIITLKYMFEYYEF